MQLNHLIDHTILKPTTLVKEINQLCNEAREYGFAAVCVPPPFVKMAKEHLENSTVKVATVIGFPFGYSAIEAKIAELVLAMVDGADELDVVANILAIKNQDRSKNRVIKVIIESGVLTRDEIIACCDIYGSAGIDFLKTSTGYAEKGASVEDVALFRKHLPEAVQIKASGGIRDYAFAKALVDAGATRLGTSSGVAIVKGAKNQSTNY